MDIFLNGLKNWKTTLLGVLALLGGLITQSDVLASGSNAQRAQIITAAVGAFFMGLFAKDADKTGVVKTDALK